MGGPVGATVLGIGITLRGVNLGYMGLDLSLRSDRPGTSDALYTYDNYAEPVAAPQIHWDIHRCTSTAVRGRARPTSRPAAASTPGREGTT